MDARRAFDFFLSLAVLALALALAPGAWAQGPGAHHGPIQLGRGVSSITILGGFDEGAATFSVRMGASGEDKRAEIRGVITLTGYIYCAIVCTITPPIGPAEYGVDIGGRLDIRGNLAIADRPDTIIKIGAGNPLHPNLGNGMMTVRGVLTAAPSGTTIAVYGTPKSLPIPLIKADSFTGTWIAGPLPAGTSLEYRPGLISLIEDTAP